MKVAVIGAGIFGVTASLTLSQNGYDVSLIESENDIMSKASKCNHNRLHFGFHYPRSVKTAKQSLDGYNMFYDKFSKSILSNFPNYYLIEKNGKITGDEFKNFCDLLEIEYKESIPENIDINMDNIVLSTLTNEPIFDYETIKLFLGDKLKESNVKLILNKEVVSSLDLEDFEIIVNTTYSNINKINSLFGIESIKLKLQDVIVPIFKIKKDKIGLTIMDGDYCTIMPKGFEQDTFLLYHVKYSVIKEVEDYNVPDDWVNNDLDFINSKIESIYNNSSFYYPFLNDCEKISYWRTIRALPINDDDERLSTISFNVTNNKVIISLLSGKITTCWLMSEKILSKLNENIINR